MPPFLGEIRMFAGSFAPRNWALCDGQLLAISEHMQLFSVIGTLYGGNGTTTFALPDLRGRVVLHAGDGPGLSSRREGQKGGAEQMTLTEAQLPNHNHLVRASDAPGDGATPGGRRPAAFGTTMPPVGAYRSGPPTSTMSADTIGNTGGGQPVPIMPPWGVVNFIIAIEGTFPSRA